MANMSFADISKYLGYDALTPMYEALVGKQQTNPFYMENPEGGPGWYLDASQGKTLGTYDPSVFDDYTFDWKNTGYGNTGTVTAFDKTGNQVGSWNQKDASTADVWGEGLGLASLAFGGLGMAGQGPLAGLFGGGGGAAATSPYSLSGGSFGTSGAIGSTGMPALGMSGATGGLTATGAGLGIGNAGTALATSGIGAGLGSTLYGGTGATSPYALTGASLGEAGAIGSTGAPALGNAGATGGLVSTGSGLAVGNPGLAAGTAGLGGIGSAVGGGSSIGNTLKDLIGGGSSGGSGSGNLNWGNLLSGLAQLYSGYDQRSSVMDLYKSLDQSFAPGSAYEKTLRQELDRRDAAAGRRSQYGPREVELQAQLAKMRSGNATTLAGLLDKSNSGLNDMLQSGIYLGKESGLTDLFGGLLGQGANTLIDNIFDDNWWTDLFGGD